MAIRPRRQRVSPGTYRRRRATAVAAVGGLGLVTCAVLGGLGGGPLTAPEPSRPVSVTVHIVQPGETLWDVARSLHPGGDVRALVDQLAAANGGATLSVGQRLVLP